MVLAGTLQRQRQLNICHNYQLCITHFHCVKMTQVEFSTLLLLGILAKSPYGDQSELLLCSNQNSLWWLFFSRKKISHLTRGSNSKPLAERAAGLVEEPHGTSKITRTNLSRKQDFVERLSQVCSHLPCLQLEWITVIESFLGHWHWPNLCLLCNGNKTHTQAGAPLLLT